MKEGDYVFCPKCNGKGEVFDHAEGILSFGLGYFWGKVKCERCKGSGFIKVQ